MSHFRNTQKIVFLPG